VLAAALSSYHNAGSSLCMMKERLFFPEAGPREMLYYPKHSEGSEEIFRVAILVSGGIAPGINAVIDGIVQRHYKYQPQGDSIQVWGLKNGFQAFQNINDNRVYLVSDKKFIQPDQRPNIVTANHINEGGSIIGTSREEGLLWHRNRIEKFDDIITKLKNNHIRILYIIGGDGSMKAAHTIANLAEKQTRDDWDLSVVGIPKTMDNDILWVWQTFGFVSAVEKAREFIDNLANEVKSNPRLGIVQLFGSESGFVVSHAVLASRTGICDIALIPEVPFSMKALGRTLSEKFEEKKGQYGLIVMAETAIPTDAMDYVDRPEKMPPYLSRKYFEERIKNNNEIDNELKEKMIHCYQMGSEGHYVYTNYLNEKEEGEVKDTE
jgi:6-phosphofructokinase 1